MKFYTSYYYQVRNFPTNLIGLSTAKWPPKYINFGVPDARGVIVVDCPPFKPGEKCAGLCDGKCAKKHPEDCLFLRTYRQQLEDEITPDFFQSLNDLADRIKNGEHLDDIDFAFIVFEKYDNPCSERWAIQDWFRKKGMAIEEWTKKSTINN